jgi:hypothetical protein
MKQNSRPLEVRLRLKLHRMEHDDRREAAKSSLDCATRTLRQRLVEENPDASPASIEAMVTRRLERGLQPTTDSYPRPQGVPPDVLAARKAVRTLSRKSPNTKAGRNAAKLLASLKNKPPSR